MSYISFAQIADELDCSTDYLLGRANVIQVNNGGDSSLTPNEKRFLALFSDLYREQQTKILGMLELYAEENLKEKAV